MAMFEDFVRIGINLTRNSDGKKIVTGMPKKWQTLTKSIFKGESNYAILTGTVNNILVIDLDNKHDFPGKEWFERNLFELKGTSETLVTSTISGGYHVYFKYTPLVKNKNDYLGLSIDILVDNKCVYEGKGYNVVSDSNEIRELTESEIRLFTQRKTENKTFEKIKDIVKNGTELESQKWLITNPRILKKINKHIPTDLAREWEIEIENNSLKCTPKGFMCIVDSSASHSVDDHCTLFINNDGSVVKNCHSHGSKTMARSEHSARALHREFKLVIELQHEETNMYCRLKDDMLDIALQCNYRRDGNGNIYKQVKPYAYVLHSEYKDFLNEIFLDDKEYERNHNNMDNLVKFLKDYDSTSFPFVKPNKRYLGFNNGILDTHLCEFIPQDKCDGSIIVKKYLDVPFTGETDTPLFDSIFDYQLTDNSEREEIKKFVYFCLGRLFNIRDKYDFTLYLMGEAGCGKSLVIDVMKHFFRDIGAISSTFEKTFGLAYLYKKDLIVCDDLPKDFSKVLPQTVFQSCISGGELSVAFKGGDAKTINWDVPLLFAGNYNPDYVDKGQISRRVVTFEFRKIVKKKDVDTGLLRRILESELPNIAYKCIKMYTETLNDPAFRDKGIWSICPEYFRENQEELKKDRNPLYKFLVEKSRYKKDNIVPISEIKTGFEIWLGKRVGQLDNGTFIQVNESFYITKTNICKKCLCEAHKSCCENYNSKERSSIKMVRNIEICE
jgi:phage/plasmid-associated DNA primase